MPRAHDTVRQARPRRHSHSGTQRGLSLGWRGLGLVPGTYRSRLARAAVAAVLAGLAAVFAAKAGAVSAATAPAAASPRSVIILLDVNSSHARTTIPQERQAALAYAHALPPDVRVGLITFSGSWKLALTPTTDRAKLAAALTASHRVGGNSVGVYDAITGAGDILRSLGTLSGTRLLVLSEGEDLIGRAFTPGIPTDVAVWNFDRDDFAARLLALASASGGHASAPAHVTLLAAAFAPLKTAAGHASAQRSAGQAAQSARPSGSRDLLVLAAIVFVALFVVTVLLLGGAGGSDRGRHLAKEFERYGPRHAPGAPVQAQQGQAASSGGSITRWVSGLLRSANREDRLAERLELAGISRNPAEWVLIGAVICLVLSLVLALVAGSVLVGILIGTMVGWLAMVIAVRYLIGRRRSVFGDQLPDVLQLLASSLQAGFSLAQAIDAVVREDSQPSAAEFSRALAETRLGVDLADALDTVANRMDSKDLRWTVMAIRIQREVGGNLAEVLRNTVATMRERAYLHRHVRALSAEGRLSAYILIGLPILVGGWLFYSSPTYMHPLYTTGIGLVMLAVTVLLLFVGSWWMSKVVKVEV